MDTMGEQARGVFYAVAATGFFSTAPVLVRLAEGIAPVEIAALRMLIGACLLGLLAWLRRETLALKPHQFIRLLPIAGAAALHFLTFIASLFLTSLAHALTLTYTAPVLLSLLARILLHESLGTRRVLGIMMSMVGTAILTGFEATLHPRMLLGDALAALSAVAIAVYSVLGRRERASFPLLTYVFWVYLLAGLLLFPLSLVGQGSTYTPKNLAAVFLLALLPLAFGHTLYNAALRLVHPALANTVATQEVTGGILLGWLLLGEVPTLKAMLGAAVTLAGVVVVLL